MKKYKAIVMGTSAGGLDALASLLGGLPSDFPLPVLVVQHRAPDYGNLLEEVFQKHCEINIKQADEKEEIKPGVVYIAPPDYHLLVEADETLSLSHDKKVLFSRPPINVLFETAALAYKESLIGIILTGSNRDGADGVQLIHQYGGLTIAQNPSQAAFPQMPLASIQTGAIDYSWDILEIKTFLLNRVSHPYEEEQ